jgi:hypothetical protein
VKSQYADHAKPTRSRIRLLERGRLRGTSLTAIVPTGGSVVAVGGSLTATAVALTSVDGRAWTPLEDDAFGNAYFTGLAADEQRVVAVGATQHRIEGTGSFRQAAAAWWSALR